MEYGDMGPMRYAPCNEIDRVDGMHRNIDNWILPADSIYKPAGHGSQGHKAPLVALEPPSVASDLRTVSGSIAPLIHPNLLLGRGSVSTTGSQPVIPEDEAHCRLTQHFR